MVKKGLNLDIQELSKVSTCKAKPGSNQTIPTDAKVGLNKLNYD